MQNTPPNNNDFVARPPVRGIERGHYLIVATPVLAVLAEFEAKLVEVRVEDPNSGRRYTLERAVSSLRDALTRAEEIELWGSLDDLEELTKRPKSTITEWAAKYGDRVWCWKKSGIWAVDIQKFDAWYRSNLPALEKRKRTSGPKKHEGTTTATSPDDAAGRPPIPEAA